MPFVHEYDGIIKSIKNSGYELDKDLFTFCYDWRKKLNKTADVLNDFIQNKVLAGRTDIDKVKIVGHSLGGLVGRSFTQKYNGSNLEKLITVGSPHQGVTQSYYAWESGEPPSERNLQWWLWQMLIQLQKRNFATNVQTIRKIAPSTQDLLPTFNFLKRDGTEINFREMIWKNDWLFNLNNSINSSFLDKSIAVVGEKGDTPFQYLVAPRNWLDELLGKWEDGKPIETFFALGDLTVLKSSGQIPGENPEILSLNHGELIYSEEGIKKIMQLLNIPEVSLEEGSKFNVFPSLTFILASPASMKIEWEYGTFESDENKMIFIPNAGNTFYVMTIFPEDYGEYKLIINQETKDKSIWQVIDGRFTDLSPIVYLFSFNNNNPVENLIYDFYGITYLDFAREKVLLLKKQFTNIITLYQIIKDIEQTKNLINQGKHQEASFKTELIIKSLFKFRKDNLLPYNRNLSFEAIKFLTKVYETTFWNSGKSINKKTIENELKSAEKLRKDTERFLKIFKNLNKLSSQNGVSYDLALEEFTKAQEAYSNNQLYRAKILLLLTRNLLQESLAF